MTSKEAIEKLKAIPAIQQRPDIPVSAQKIIARIGQANDSGLSGTALETHLAGVISDAERLIREAAQYQ